MVYICNKFHKLRINLNYSKYSNNYNKYSKSFLLDSIKLKNLIKMSGFIHLRVSTDQPDKKSASSSLCGTIMFAPISVLTNKKLKFDDVNQFDIK